MTTVARNDARQPHIPDRRRPSVPPRTTDWADAAAQVATRLADRPAALLERIALLKEAGLVALLAPATHGGAGQSWSTAYRVLRELAAADEVLSHLLAQHYLWSWAAYRAGDPDQAEAILATATQNRWFFAGPVNPGAHEVRIRDDGRHLVFNGRHFFTAGSTVSDVTVLDGSLEDRDARQLAVVPSHHAGLTFHDDADDHGDRPTTVGGERATHLNGVCVAEVRVPSTGLSGVDGWTLAPRTQNDQARGIRRLMLSHIELGALRAAVRAAAVVSR
jgi:alkylation response protein AidB-like acyl-CoA dehydrogenase